MSSTATTDPIEPPHRSDRLVYLLLVLAIIGLLVAVPFTLRSIGVELLGAQQEVFYDFPGGDPVTLAAAKELEAIESFYNITLLDVDESAGSIDIALSGNRHCENKDCPELTVTLIAYNGDVLVRRGLPPTETISIPTDVAAFSDQVTLPIVGWPSQYPFDRYRLRIGVAFARIEDGKTLYLPPDQVNGYSYGAIQNATRDLIMGPPVEVPLDTVFDPSDPFSPAGVQDVELKRPVYLLVLSVTLVSLITVSSALSLMSRAVNEALVGIGSLVLGVWGVRSVLVPANLGVVSSIDIALSLVIMMLMIGLTVRSAQHIRQRSAINLLPRRSRD